MKIYITYIIKSYIISNLLKIVKSDLPIHCLRSQIVGKWKFLLKNPIESPNIEDFNCGHQSPYKEENYMLNKTNSFNYDHSMELILHSDFSVNNLNNEFKLEWNKNNTWTNIYDEAFEINYKNYSFFAFFDFEKKNFNDTIQEFDYITNCAKTIVGWYRFKNLTNSSKGCFVGQQLKGSYNVSKHSINKDLPFNNNYEEYVTKNSDFIKNEENIFNKSFFAAFSKVDKDETTLLLKKYSSKKKIKTSRNNKNRVEKYIEEINKDNKLWKAKKYPYLQNKNLTEIYNYFNKNKKKSYYKDIEKNPKKGSKFTEFSKIDYKILPKNFDWEDKIPKPIEQGSCGSCYLIAAKQMLESRLKIKYNKTIDISLSFINDCNYFSQGCDGGYAYEVFRFLHEHFAVPYKCKKNKNYICEHFCDEKEIVNLEIVKVKKYGYIKTDYKINSEKNIMWEIFKNGPVVVSFKSPLDLGFYEKGIYWPVQNLNSQKFDKGEVEWVEVNHSVLVYGWGEHGGVRFWRVQNSWGEKWGEHGRFKIVRGMNILGFESMPEFADPVLISLNV